MLKNSSKESLQAYVQDDMCAKISYDDIIHRQSCTSITERITCNRNTLRFFHQYLRFSFVAVLSNCEAPSCSASVQWIENYIATYKQTE